MLPVGGVTHEISERKIKFPFKIVSAEKVYARKINDDRWVYNERREKQHISIHDGSLNEPWLSSGHEPLANETWRVVAY